MVLYQNLSPAVRSQSLGLARSQIKGLVGEALLEAHYLPRQDARQYALSLGPQQLGDDAQLLDMWSAEVDRQLCQQHSSRPWRSTPPAQHAAFAPRPGRRGKSVGFPTRQF